MAADLRLRSINEATLINLIKYFIRVVMVDYQLLVTISPWAEHSQKAPSQHSQTVMRF